MSLIVRVVFYAVIGLTTGLLAWPFAELVIYLQASFPSLLLFSIVLGVVIGLFVGGGFGTSGGIIASSPRKLRAGVLTGLAIGALGGVIGFVTGQAALLLIGTPFFNSAGRFASVGIPLSRSIGWAAFGLVIGLSEGVRERSWEKVKHGMLGGFLGGAVGGTGFEFLRSALPENDVARLIGLLVLGLGIGLFYGFIENRLARATLRLLNGKNRGREYPLIPRVSRIGTGDLVEVPLSGYDGVAAEHARLLRNKGTFEIEPTEAGKTYVNDAAIGEKVALKPNAVIRVGGAQFILQVR